MGVVTGMGDIVGGMVMRGMVVRGVGVVGGGVVEGEVVPHVILNPRLLMMPSVLKERVRLLEVLL